MRHNIWRSHFDSFDVIWLANCMVANQVFSFKLGYFHKRITQKEWELQNPNGDRVLIELPTELLDLPEPRIVLNSQLQKVDASIHTFPI